MEKFNTLLKSFGALLQGDLIKSQFEDFLLLNYSHIKDMAEEQFIRWVVNHEKDGSYDDFLQYVPLLLMMNADIKLMQYFDCSCSWECGL